MATSIIEPRPEGVETGDLYRSDFYAWAERQAEALRRRDQGALDWENLQEEVEGLARKERAAWRGPGRAALVHMLCVQYARERVAGGAVKAWHDEIHAFRAAMGEAVKDSPSLQGQFDEMFAEMWRDARDEACSRLGVYAAQAVSLPAEKAHPFEQVVRAEVPKDCPYRVEHFFSWDEKERAARREVWPPGVAVVFNTVLGTEYPVLSDRERDVRRQLRELRFGRER